MSGHELTPDGTLAPWVREAMERAAAHGIDPRRVAVALGVPMGALGFDVEVNTTVEHIGLLTASGPLGADAAERLARALAIVPAETPVVVLDLTAVTRCDEAGVQAVVDLDARLRDAGLQLVVRPAPDAVDRVFRQTRAADGLRVAGRERADAGG